MPASADFTTFLSQNMPKKNIMIGPAPSARGGISTVVTQYRDNGILKSLDCLYLTSFAPAGAIRKSWLALSTLLRLLALLITNQVGVVHIQTASYNSFYRKAAFAWLAYLFRRPVVLHVHGAEFLKFFTSRPAITRLFIRATMRRAARIIALSEYWADNFSSLINIDRRNIDVVPNPMQIAEKSVRRTTLRRLLFLGDIGQRKGCYDLIDALALLKERGIEVELRCGGGGEVEQLVAYAAGKGVQDELNMLGWIDAKTKADELQHADLFVLPSHFEGTPMTILEAMAAGVPVISSNAGGIPDMLQQGRLGEIVASGDSAALAAAIEQNLRDPTEMRRRADLAYEVIREQYDPRVIGAQLDALYRSFPA